MQASKRMLNKTDSAVRLFDIAFDNVTFPELCARIEDRIRMRAPSYIVTPNVDHVCRYHADPEFRQAYDNAYMLVCDGMPLVWASRVFGSPIREKLSGSDLLARLSGFAAERGFSVYLCGAREGVASAAAERLTRELPGLRVAGAYSPPLGFYADGGLTQQTIDRIREARPDICFMALGAPHQETWMWRHVEDCQVPIMIGVGGAFDFLAGRVKRAPAWMQRAGLEWLWRLFHEPRRLWRRYLIEDLRIVTLLWREIWNRRERRTRSTHQS